MRRKCFDELCARVIVSMECFHCWMFNDYFVTDKFFKTNGSICILEKKKRPLPPFIVQEGRDVIMWDKTLICSTYFNFRLRILSIFSKENRILLKYLAYIFYTYCMLNILQ